MTGSGHPDRVVRAARAGDADAFVALRAAMFEAMGRDVRSNGVDAAGSAWRAAAAAWFADAWRDPAVKLIMVEMGGVVVADGLGTLQRLAPSPSLPTGRSVLISNISTLPAQRGRGHGRAAFDAVVAWAREVADGAELFATGDGRGMYERAGFVVHAYPVMRANFRSTW